MHNLLLADDHSMTDGIQRPPATAQPPDTAALLDAVAPRMYPEGVILLSGSWTRLVAPYSALPGEEWTEVTAGEWTTRLIPGDVWIRWVRGTGKEKRAVWTAEYDRMEPSARNAPLLGPDALSTARNLNAWTRATGWPWAGRPGMAGNSYLVNTWSTGEAPRWNGRLPASTWGPCEMPYKPGQWSRPCPAGHVPRGYDLNRAYLSALMNLEVAAERLDFRAGPHDFDAKRGGLWRVDACPWPENEPLPDPAGYGHVLPDGTRWLTTQTLVLLRQLEEAGRYGGFSVRSSYTAPARRLFRPFASLLRDIIAKGETPLPHAAKRVYQVTHGAWERPGLIHRPDWYRATVAMARVNLWRRMDRAFQADGMIPLSIDTDCVTYPVPEGTGWAEGAPSAFTLDPEGVKLGAFKPYETETDTTS